MTTGLRVRFRNDHRGATELSKKGQSIGGLWCIWTWGCRAVTSEMTQCILRGCAKLESFDGYQIQADDMIQYADDDSAMACGPAPTSAMDVDGAIVTSRTGLASPPPSPLQDSPISSSMFTPISQRQLSQQHYGRSALWMGLPIEKQDQTRRMTKRDSISGSERTTTASRLWWSCDRIRHLDLHITGLGPYSDPRHKAVFEQLGRLEHLVHLSIGSKGNSKSSLSGPMLCSVTGHSSVEATTCTSSSTLRLSTD